MYNLHSNGFHHKIKHSLIKVIIRIITHIEKRGWPLLRETRATRKTIVNNESNSSLMKNLSSQLGFCLN